MKASGNDSAAVVEFTGKVQRIARVHQNGLSDKPQKNSRMVKYEKRALLGFNSETENDINDIVVKWVSLNIE